MYGSPTGHVRNYSKYIVCDISLVIVFTNFYFHDSILFVGQVPLYNTINNGQQYVIPLTTKSQSNKNGYGRAPPNPLATKFDNLQASSSGLPLSRLQLGKTKTKSQPTQPAQRPGPPGLLNTQGNIEKALVPVKSLHPMTTEQQLRTVFVSKIPELMDTNTLRAIVEVIPGVETVVRLLNGRSENLSFGFVRFLTVDAIKVFVDTFKQIDYSSLTNENFDALFNINYEENTGRYLDDLIAEKGEDYFQNFSRTSEKERIDNASRQIKTWYELTSANYGDNLTLKLQSALTEDGDPNKDNDIDFDLDEANMDSINIDEQEFADLEIEDKETVLREIKEFRLSSIKFEKVKKDKDVEEKKERDKYLEKLTSKVLEDAKDAAKQHGDENTLFTELDFGELSDTDEELSETDEEYEKRRQARIRQKEERAFEEDQRRWIAREQMHSSALEREKLRDANLDERIERDRQKALQRYAEFVDDGDYERKNLEYYDNHATWVKNRMAMRRREILRDEQDAREEAEENEQKNTEKESFLSSLASEFTSKPTSAPTGDSVGKFKLSLGNVAKKPAPVRNEHDEEEEHKDTIRALLADADYDNLKDIDEFKALSKQDPLVTSIIDKIPQESAALFAAPVNWELLTDDIVEDRLKPFITTLIMEYLGIQEDELIAFITTHLKEHKTADSLVSELEMTLDEDAVVFTQKLWRLLIFETERHNVNL